MKQKRNESRRQFIQQSAVLPQTQEIIEYCAEHKIYPEVQLIKASEANDTWEKVINKEARYRYVIAAATF